MSCNLPSRGKQIDFIIIDGTVKFNEILERITTSLPKNEWKINSIVETEEGSYLISILGNSNRIIGICIETPSGEIISGNKALYYIRKLNEGTPYRGYIELIEIGKSGLDLDLESSASVKLDKEISISNLLNNNINIDMNKTVTEDKAVDNYSSTVNTHNKLKIIDKISKKNNISLNEIEMLLAEIIIYSRVEETSKNYNELLKKAIDKSRNNENIFYRLAIQLLDNSMLEVFVYNGSICSSLMLPSKEYSTRNVEPTLKSIISIADQIGVLNAILYKVECEECAKIFLKNCEIKKGEQRIPNREKEKKSQRRGLLKRLFRKR